MEANIKNRIKQCQSREELIQVLDSLQTRDLSAPDFFFLAEHLIGLHLLQMANCISGKFQFILFADIYAGIYRDGGVIN